MRLNWLSDKVPVWVAALWWGSLATIGFLVVPLLFAHLPTAAMAGTVAAKLFTAQTWVSLACGLALLVLARGERTSGQPNRAKAAFAFTLGGMLLALLLEFGVAPRILARENLALWHRLGTGMYVLQWICAGVTFWKVADSRSA